MELLNPMRLVVQHHYCFTRLTFDIDVFVFLPHPQPKNIIILSSLYEELRKRGYSEQKEHIMIDTNRPKDRQRIVQVIENSTVNKKLLLKILKNHHLQEKWEATIGKSW